MDTNLTEYADYYSMRCAVASEDQGINALSKALDELNIPNEIAQTGGFTMCAYIPLEDSLYIYANQYGAGLYGEEDFIKDIYENESEGDQLARIKDVAQGIAKWIKENNHTVKEIN